MTCKDCVHYEVCKDDVELHHDFYDCLEEDGVEKHCEYFKPKSRFVELPCEVGQTVYMVRHCKKEIVSLRVIQIDIDINGIWVRADDGIFHCVRRHKDYCYSREEAEKALSERSK